MLKNIRDVLTQVDGLVAVDNGSSDAELEPVREASRNLGFHLIENGDNLGIAEALNQGVRWARSGGFDWVATFDQDARISDDFTANMLETYRENSNREKVAIVAPHYVDRESGIQGTSMRTDSAGILATMTSGSMMPVSAIERLGLFDESLFMDYVDIEFCLRARRKGMRILESQAIIYHVLGRTTYHRFCGLSFAVTNHSAARRYYITRNRLRLLARYIMDWSWAWRESKALLSETIKIIMVENAKWEKFRAIAAGAADALTGKVGKHAEL
jgi:rhamnosyltransferase